MNKKIKKARSAQKPGKPAPTITKNTIKPPFIIFIVIFSFALYAQSLTFDYAYDDITVIQGNKLVQSGVKSIPDLMSSDYWYGFTGRKQGSIFRPVSLIMFAIEWQLFGSNPLPGHLINVLLFSLTCALMYVLLSRLFASNVFAFICTLLYAAHPIHTEVVNNIKSRDEILCFLFSITALLFYFRYYSGKNLYPLIAGALFFFFAMLSKETGIVFWILIPLTLFVFAHINKRRLLYVGITLTVTALIYLALRQMISNHRPLTEGIGLEDNFLIQASAYSERLASAIHILLNYVRLLIFPHPLSCDYSFAQLQLKSFSDGSVILGVVVFAAATVFAVLKIRARNVYAYGILFFLITIFPVSNIPFLFGSSMAERFLYMPSFGFCILLTLLIFALTKTALIKHEPVSLPTFFKKYKTAVVIGAIIVCLYSLKTIERSRDWRNNLVLFQSAVRTSPNSTRAHYGYGAALFSSALANEGSPTEIAEKFDLSKKEYEAALSIFPEYSSAYMGLGLFYKNKQDYKNSVINFEKARAHSRSPDANIYKELGYAYLKNQQFELSIAALDSSLAMSGATANVLNFKGSALFGLKKYNEALSSFLAAAELDPVDVGILQNIGRCYFYLHDNNNAVTYFKRCINLQPANSDNYKYLGLIYQVMNDTVSANSFLRQYEKTKAQEK